MHSHYNFGAYISTGGSTKSTNKYIANQMVGNAVGEKKAFSKENRKCWGRVVKEGDVLAET